MLRHYVPSRALQNPESRARRLDPRRRIWRGIVRFLAWRRRVREGFDGPAGPSPVIYPAYSEPRYEARWRHRKMPLIVGAHPQNPSLSILARRREAVERCAKRDCSSSFMARDRKRSRSLRRASSRSQALVQRRRSSQGRGPFYSGLWHWASRPEVGGLIVRADSGIRRVADLKGHGIGLMPVSWHTQFLAAELAAAGLHWRDVRAAEIIPQPPRTRLSPAISTV